MTFPVLYRSMGGTSSGLPIVSSHSSAFSWGGRCGTGSLSGEIFGEYKKDGEQFGTYPFGSVIVTKDNYTEIMGDAAN